jgi:membrane peptidoglycan carboxypeptidase
MMVTGIWIGNDDNSPTNRASGGNLPAQVWSQFMAAAHDGWSPMPLPGTYIFRDPANMGLVPPQAILGADGVYDEYLQRYEPGPNGEFIQPPPGIPPDRYDPNYDPRYDPNMPDGMVDPNGVIGGGGQPLPPAPIGGGDPGGYQPAPPPPQGGGFLRRILGLN